MERPNDFFGNFKLDDGMRMDFINYCLNGSATQKQTIDNERVILIMLTLTFTL